MKKFILGIVIGLLVALPVSTYARIVIETPKTNPIYDISSEAHISVFDDADNKCYIAAYNSTDQPTISCVKR